MEKWLQVKCLNSSKVSNLFFWYNGKTEVKKKGLNGLDLTHHQHEAHKEIKKDIKIKVQLNST